MHDRDCDRRRPKWLLKPRRSPQGVAMRCCVLSLPFRVQARMRKLKDARVV